MSEQPLDSIMELEVSFLLTGILIIVATVWRGRQITGFIALQRRMKDTLDIPDLDFSGNTEYTDCYSHRWMIENVVKKAHSKYGAMFQDHLMYNTFLAVLWIGVVLGIISMIIVVFFISSMRIIGSAVLVFLFGFIIIIGPGNPKTSELFLEDINSLDFSHLNNEDYVYVTLAVRTVKRWLVIAFIIGVSLVAVAPWAIHLPTAAALVVAVFSDVFLWTPALFLADFWFPLSLIYLAGLPILLFYLIPRSILSVLRKRDETS